MTYPHLITLAGFMGTGKTAVGQSLARTIHYLFSDSDRDIAAKEGRSIQEIFEKEGEPYFRKIEKETIFKLANNSPLILSVGGGAILDPEILQLLSKKGVVVLLTASVDEITRRLGHDNERPLLSRGNRKKKIEKLLKERSEIYSKVPIQIDTTGLAIDEVVQKIIQRISS